MNNKQYAIIIRTDDDELHCIEIGAQELLHVAYITEGLTRRDGRLEAIAVKEQNEWVPVA